MYTIYKWFKGKPLKLSEADTWDEALVHCEAYYKRTGGSYLIATPNEEIHSYNDLCL